MSDKQAFFWLIIKILIIVGAVVWGIAAYASHTPDTKIGVVRPYRYGVVMTCTHYLGHCGEYATRILEQHRLENICRVPARGECLEFYKPLAPGDLIFDLSIKGLTQAQIERVTR